MNYSIVAMRKCNPRTLSSPRTAYFKKGVQFENLFNLEKVSHQCAPGTGLDKVCCWRVIPARAAGSQLHHTFHTSHCSTSCNAHSIHPSSTYWKNSVLLFRCNSQSADRIIRTTNYLSQIVYDCKVLIDDAVHPSV